MKRYISLDLDETMIHTIPSIRCRGIKDLPVASIDKFKNGESYFESFIYKRPGVDDLLQSLTQIGELNVFSLGMGNYVHLVLEKTGLAKYFARVFPREACHDRAWQLSDEELESYGCSRSVACMMKDLRMVCPDVLSVVAIDDNLSVYF